MIDREIDGRIAWTRATLAPDEGGARLSDACLAELLDAAAQLRVHPLPVLAHGPGFAIVERLPLERIDRAEAVALFWLLSSLIARPVAQKWDGTMVYDVRDTGRTPGNGVRPDVTNAEQSFHTDNSYNLCPPEYVG